MNTKKIIASAFISAGILYSVMSMTVLTTYAQTATGTKTSTVAAQLAKIVARSDTAITNRIDDLNKLNDRVKDFRKVSDTEKSAVLTAVQTNITGLTTLKAKIDADTDAKIALADEKLITGSYRIYALVVPQGYIESSADRVTVIAGLMTALSTKLQARITEAQIAGKNVTTLQTALTDLNAKIADAISQANIAQAGVATLIPDQGDVTKLKANTAALKAARTNLKTAAQDLAAARKDEKTIIEGLKVLGGKSMGTSSTTPAHN